MAAARHDAQKATASKTYPACTRLKGFYEELTLEEQERYNVENTYQTWMDAGALHCGKERVGWGLLGRKHNELWKAGCVTEVLPAKRRLLGFMEELCNAQAEAIKSHPVAEGAKKATRGVIYTGKGEHFRDIFQSILGLRLLNVTLPAEIWVNARDLAVCKAIFHTRGNGDGVCKTLPDSVSGFASKFYALLSTTLTEVLFVDADNIAVRDPNAIFDSEQFRKYGAVVWPDLWGAACRNIPGQDNGETAYPTHVLWMARFAGLKWDANDHDKAQEAEAGMVAYDLRRHAGLLELGRKFIEDRRFLKRVVNGDKDIFRFVHLAMGEPFYFVPHFPGLSFAENKPGYGRDCITHYWGGEGEEQPMFFHQLKARDPDAFLASKRVTKTQRRNPSACVDLGFREGLEPLVLEKHADGERLRQFATRLFADSDKRWQEQALDSLLWAHDWKIFFDRWFAWAVFGSLLLLLVVLRRLRGLRGDREK